MRLSSLLLAAPLLGAVQALHFYFDSNEKRCFLEELPSDTIVEGHYKAFMWDDNANTWKADPKLGIQVNVEDLSTGGVVVDTRGPHEGRFTFTSNDPGDHNICLTTNITAGWTGNDHIKMYLDINVGSSRKETSDDSETVNTLAGKLRELNKKVADIQREQRYLREVEATFRDTSELTNSRAVWWSILQIVLLVGLAAWQMRHLKVYFDDKKLR